MTTWRDLTGATTARREAPAVVAIGTFDGVHRGHRALLDRAHRAALDIENRAVLDIENRAALDVERSAGSPVVAVTFDPHPTEVVRPDRCPPLLTTTQRRVDLLHEAGADEVRVLAFDREMAGWSPGEFVDRVLVQDLSAEAVVVGENFTYGSRAAGDVSTLADSGRRAGFEVVPVGLVGDDAGEVWSSTRVRALVADGRLEDAAAVLGRPHEVSGVVVRGQQRGRELGYPTANVPVDARYAVPPDGVYAGRVVRATGERLPAAVSIGTNPTFGEHDRRVESYVLDRDDLDLYGESIRVELIQRLRGMEAFDGVDALLDQMARDVAATRTALA